MKEEKQPTANNLIDDVVMCEMVEEFQDDYVVKVYKKTGSPILIRVPKGFNEWGGGQEPMGLNLVFNGHYE